MIETINLPGGGCFIRAITNKYKVHNHKSTKRLVIEAIIPLFIPLAELKLSF